MSVLHRFSLGYSKTVGEISRADVSLYLSSLTVNIQKDGGKKAFSVAWFSATRRTPHKNTVVVFFFHFHTWLLLGNVFSLKSKRDYINIKYTTKRQSFPRLMPK